MIISVLFDKKKFDTKKARDYLKKKNLIAIKKVHITDRYYRYRINKAKKNRKFQTWNVKTDGVKYIVSL